MPKIRRSRTKPPPEGFELIEPTLKDLESKMREIESKPHIGLTKNESLWPVFRIHHQRSRYIYDLYYKRKTITKELYDYCVKEGYADANLIAKWKKPGYENLCCLKCIEPTQFDTVCVCRVPRDKRDEEKKITCLHCGCRGCGGG